MIRELTPYYENRRSYYGKAQVEIDCDNTRTLYSYGTPIIRIDSNGKVSRLWAGESATTLRHVKEFLLQNGRDYSKKAYDAMEVKR